MAVDCIVVCLFWEGPWRRDCFVVGLLVRAGTRRYQPSPSAQLRDILFASYLLTLYKVSEYSCSAYDNGEQIDLFTARFGPTLP